MCYSGSGGRTAAEPIAAVSMNDELQSARASVAKAEADILEMLTEKVKFKKFGMFFFLCIAFSFLTQPIQMQMDLYQIEDVMKYSIQLDVVSLLSLPSIKTLFELPKRRSYSVSAFG